MMVELEANGVNVTECINIMKGKTEIEKYENNFLLMWNSGHTYRLTRIFYYYHI